MNLRFTGHETFVARTFWPKKGYDYLKSGKRFSDEDAVVHLGVGKNMVPSIQFWMKALGLIDLETGSITEIADFIFDDNGSDPLLEDIGTIWLLHYLLVKTNYSSIYRLVFNELRKERSSFKKEQLLSYIRRKYLDIDSSAFNPKTIGKDISVFIRTYRKLNYSAVTKNFEDEVSGLMLELELLPSTIEEELEEGSGKKKKVEWFHINGGSRPTLPSEIVLFTILDSFEGSNNIAFRRLEIEENCPALVFLLSKEALYDKLKELESIVDGVTITETAGNIVFSIAEGINKWDILKKYYAN